MSRLGLSEHASHLTLASLAELEQVVGAHLRGLSDSMSGEDQAEIEPVLDAVDAAVRAAADPIRAHLIELWGRSPAPDGWVADIVDQARSTEQLPRSILGRPPLPPGPPDG